MHVLLLAAGYSRRLYPLTENFPKPLLDIGGRPIIEHIIEKLSNLKDIKNIYIVTNQKYYQHFLNWKKDFKTNFKIEILNDGTLSNEDRLGAIGDINFVIENKKINDDLLILGGDQLFNFSLNEFVNFFNKNKRDITMVVKERNKEYIKQSSCVTLDKNNKITFFEEKPQNPKSNLISRCIYIYKKDTLKLIKQYLSEGNNSDQPGRFVQWLHTRKEVLGFVSKENVIDIGTHETLEKARKNFISFSSS